MLLVILFHALCSRLSVAEADGPSKGIIKSIPLILRDSAVVWRCGLENDAAVARQIAGDSDA